MGCNYEVKSEARSSFVARVPWKRMLEGEREFAEDRAWRIKNRDTIVSVG